MEGLDLILLNQNFKLLPEKALYWENNKILIIADAHFGKITHFRSEGFAVSPQAIEENLRRLKGLLNKYEIDRIIFIGDVFHSDYNKEWDLLSNLLGELKFQLQVDLVPGNHDILNTDIYENAGINLHQEIYHLPPVFLSHYPLRKEVLKEGQLNIAGHIHPGVRLQGSGKQHVKLPCFYLKKDMQLILPSFGSFTGIYMISPSEKDRVFVILDNQIREIPVD